MVYCAKADLQERFGDAELAQLTDEVAGTTISDAEVTAACDEATSLIDGFVGARYTLPLASVPSILKTWGCDIARFFLWGDRAVEGSAVRANYEEAVARLKDVAAGRFRLFEADGDQVGGGSGSIAVVASDQVFTDDLLSLMP